MGNTRKNRIAEGAGISVDAGAFSQALARVITACHRKATIPILSTARLAAGHSRLEIFSTDLDIEIRTHVAAAGKLEAVCVDPRVLRDIVRGLPATQRVTLALRAANELLVLVDEEEWLLPAVDAKDWPKTKRPEDAPKHGAIQLDAGFVGDVLARVAPFISNEETRYYLNGVCLDPDGDRLFSVTTDGHRLGRVERNIAGVGAAMEAAGYVAGERRCIVSSLLVRAAVNLVRGPARLTISASPFLCRIDTEAVSITGRMIDGTYPDYHRVLCEATDAGYEVDRLAFLSALGRLKAIEARGSSCGLTLCWRKGALYLDRRDADRGRASIPVPAAPLRSWPDQPISFDRRYLVAIVQQIRGSAFRLHWTGSASSQVRISDASDPASTFILMPMRGETALPHEPPVPPAEPEVRAAE